MTERWPRSVLDAGIGFGLFILFGDVLETCSSCAFLDLCYSGCMFHSLKNSASPVSVDEKDYYCAGYRIYFEHLLRRVHTNVVLASERLSRV